MKRIINILKDNAGDENISKTIWVAVAFVAGAILLVLLTVSIRNPIKTWLTNTIKSWFSPETGEFAYGISDAPGSGFDGPGDSLH